MSDPNQKPPQQPQFQPPPQQSQAGQQSQQNQPPPQQSQAGQQTQQNQPPQQPQQRAQTPKPPSAQDLFKEKMDKIRSGEKYKSYHGKDPIRTKPYNYAQQVMHEEDYHKQLHFYELKVKQRDKEYDEMYVKKRPKNWEVKKNPNRWFANGNMNSYHKEAPRYKNPEPWTVFPNAEQNPEFTYTKKQDIPYKRLYVDYDNIYPPSLETQQMKVQHSMQFQRDPRQSFLFRNNDRLTPFFQTEIQQYNENLPYEIQNEQMNQFNAQVNQGNYNPNYQNVNHMQHMDIPVFHSPSIQHNPYQQYGYPYSQYRFY